VPKKQKKIVPFVHSFIIIFGKITFFLKSHPFPCLVKGIVLGQTLWGANTFPTRNWLPEPKSDFLQTLCYLLGFFVVFQNKLWVATSNSFFANFTFGSLSRRNFGCDRWRLH